MAMLRAMDPREVLAHIGLDPKEISVYLALLDLGEATVLKLSKKAAIKRPTAYLVLDALETKGFVVKSLKGGKTVFTAQHPRKIRTEAELRLKEIQEVVPQLEAMLQHKDNRPRVVVYEGKSALDKAYDDYFLVKGEILFMSNIDLVQDIFSRTLQKFDYISTSSDFKTRDLG